MGTHIVLFIKENRTINFSKLIEDMYLNYKEIGEGVVLNNSNINPNKPNFMFQKNKDLLIDGNFHHITLNIFGDYENMIEDIIEMLWDAFDLNDLEFIKIGYIKDFKLDSVNIEDLKERLFLEKRLKDTDEFQLAYHSILKFKRESLNCWKRYTKFINQNLIVGYDINNKKDITEVNYKYIKEFLTFCNKFIEKEMEEFK